MNIGYTFANVLLRREDGGLGVDVNLLNDVTEQNGGGGEPFMYVGGGTDFVGAAVGAAGKVANAAQNVAERTQDQVVVTTLNVAGRTRQAVVHFKNGINTGGPDDESVSGGEAPDDGSTESVEKKNL